MPEEIDARSSIGFVEPTHEISDEEWEKISAFFDPRAVGKIKKDDVFPFRFVAASDGLDAYYTKQDVPTSLEPMSADLRAGQAWMGNHDITSWAYGNSFDGRVVDADALSRAYEPTFYRKYDRPELRASKWLVGDYYVRRDLHLNGESTDELIKSMEAGISRKASITFTIGEYICGIDGQQMGDMSSLLFGSDTPDEECRHFPGIEYKGDLSYAVMKHTSLLETSSVYKNASPGSLYLARATAMAEQGMIPRSDLRRVEEQVGMRLPRPKQLVFPTGATSINSASGGYTTTTIQPEKETPMAKASTTKREADAEIEPAGDAPETPEAPAAPETTETPEAPDAPETDAPEGDQAEQQEGSDGEDTVAEFVASTERLIHSEGEQELSTEHLDQVAEVGRSLDAFLVKAGREDTASGGAARQYEMREHAIEETLGEKLTVEAIRSLKANADMGLTLYQGRVAEAKAARIRAFGADQANADAYEKQLMAMRDVAYVDAEIAAYSGLAQTKLGTSAPRQAHAPDAPETKAPRRVPKEVAAGREQRNLLERHPKES